MIGPMVQWLVQWSNGRFNGPMDRPIVQLLVQWSNGRSNGPMVQWPVATLLFKFDFIASFLWAPPVATQFSVVWAPPVTTLVISLHRSISVGTACDDSAFCSVIQCFVHTYIHTYLHTHIRAAYVRAPPVATLLCHLSSSPLLSGPRRGGHTHSYIHTQTYTHTDIHTYIHTYTHTHIHTYIHTYAHTHIHTHVHTYICT